MLLDLLKNKNCFKLILGAGNKNVEEIEKIVALYYEAGCRFFDVSADINVIKRVRKIAPDAAICVSFAVSGDPHIRKAQIDKKLCAQCGLCTSNCPQKAIKDFTVDIKSCIGCAVCTTKCPNGAIKLYEDEIDFKKMLESVVAQGVQCIELHAQNADAKEAKEKWDLISKKFKGIKSLCVGEDDIELAKNLIKYEAPYNVIIQADGKPMSGCDNEIETTMPAILCAKKFHELNLPVFILVSGGTN
jgi:Pyruvate/2-oxoacid:ferredoxin oxidoreductase delta subunit